MTNAVKNTGRSGHSEQLDDGRELPVGQTATDVDLSEESPGNQRLLNEGAIIVVGTAEPDPDAEDFDQLVAKARDLNIGGNLERMRPETLRERIAIAEQEGGQ